MIVLHKDHPVYNLPDEPIGTGRYHHNLGDKYYLKFKEHFDKNNLDYRLTYYEDYPNVDGEYFIGRFAHAKEDRELHSKVYYELEKRFDNIWPNKLTYLYQCLLYMLVVRLNLKIGNGVVCIKLNLILFGMPQRE